MTIASALRSSNAVHSTASVNPRTQSRTANPAQQVLLATRTAAQRHAEALATFRLHQEQMVAQVAQRIERERAELDELRRQRRRRIRTTFVAQFPGRPLNVALLPARATEPLLRYIETGNNHDFRRGFAELALTDEQHARIEENLAATRAAHAAENDMRAWRDQVVALTGAPPMTVREAVFATQNHMVNGDLVHGLPEDN